MVKRRNHPCIHSWALPGGFLEIREDAAAAAARELEEETGLTGIPMEQLGCYANYDRDPRWRLVTISFLALLEPGFHNVAAGDDAADAVWMDVDCHRETERTDNQRQYTGYRLVLSNEERQIRIGALVEIGENQRGYIRERTLTVCENEGIAFDHAKFITEAVLTLLSRIEKNGSGRSSPGISRAAWFPRPLRFLKKPEASRRRWSFFWRSLGFATGWTGSR